MALFDVKHNFIFQGDLLPPINKEKHTLYFSEDKQGLPALVSSGSKSPSQVQRMVGLGIFYFKFPLAGTSFPF